MKKNIPIYTMCLWAALHLAACTSHDDTAWPADGAPLELYAAVQDYAGTHGNAATRATTDGTWDGGETVRLYVNDEYSDAYIGVNGKLINTDRWTKNLGQKEVYAQYPFDSPSFVEEDQSAAGYQNSDYMFAPKIIITILSPDNTLVFRHLPAKVVVHLKAGNGVTDREIQNATVTFENLNRKWKGRPDESSGTIGQATPAGDRIIPNEVLPAAEGYTRTVRALFVPQDMSGRKLLKIVTTGGKTFYYTPAAGKADFVCGKLYEFRLTVTSLGITDSTVEGGIWAPN